MGMDRSPAGGKKRWTLKDFVQGKPLGLPTHPGFVHFPIAFYTMALVLDVLSGVGDFPAAPTAATWAIVGAFVGTLFAVPTGLLDRHDMPPGSRLKRTATRHMLLQFAAFAVFVVNLIVRWSDRSQPEADVVWIVLDVIGVLLMGAGAALGGHMVFRLGMRVQTSEQPSPEVRQP
jgi:uncharacterized membrane protein